MICPQPLNKTSGHAGLKGSCLLADLTTGHLYFHYFALTMRYRRWAIILCAENIRTILTREKKPPWDPTNPFF